MVRFSAMAAASGENIRWSACELLALGDENETQKIKKGERAMLDLINVNYDTRIPNNVGLSEDRKVLKALEKWHPGYIDWWNRLIPQNFQESMVYLRTAVSVDPKGWAKFDYVKMPESNVGVCSS